MYIRHISVRKLLFCFIQALDMMEQGSSGRRTLIPALQRSVKLEGTTVNRVLFLPTWSGLGFLVTRLCSVFRGRFSVVRKCLNKSSKKEVRQLLLGYSSFIVNCGVPQGSRLEPPVFLYWWKCFCSAQVAVKCVSKKLLKKEQVAHEADLLRRVQNHQVAALLDTYESPSSLMLILELWVSLERV